MSEESAGKLSGILSAESSFQGVIIFEGILRIDGVMRGNILCRPGSFGSLIIGDKARVDLDLLLVDNLYVAGDFYCNGHAIVLEEAEFHAKSRAEVNKNFALYSSHLTVKEKALFQGKSVMIRHESPEKKAEIKKMVFEKRLGMIKEPFSHDNLSFREQARLVAPSQLKLKKKTEDELT